MAYFRRVPNFPCLGHGSPFGSQGHVRNACFRALKRQREAVTSLLFSHFVINCNVCSLIMEIQRCIILLSVELSAGMRRQVTASMRIDRFVEEHGEFFHELSPEKTVRYLFFFLVCLFFF